MQIVQQEVWLAGPASHAKKSGSYCRKPSLTGRVQNKFFKNCLIHCVHQQQAHLTRSALQTSVAWCNDLKKIEDLSTSSPKNMHVLENRRLEAQNGAILTPTELSSADPWWGPPMLRTCLAPWREESNQRFRQGTCTHTRTHIHKHLYGAYALIPWKWPA